MWLGLEVGCWLSPVEVWCVGRTLNKCIIHEGRETIKEKLRTDGQLVKPLGSDASMGIEYRQWGMREKKEHRRTMAAAAAAADDDDEEDAAGCSNCMSCYGMVGANSAAAC